MLTPSKLNSNPPAYEGQQVTVTGYVILEPGGHVLYESRKLHEEFKARWESDDKTFQVKDFEKYCLTIAKP